MASATGPTDTDVSGPVIAEQVVVVTGGGRGLGRSIAEAFLREGARVVVNYHQSREAAEHLAGAHTGRAIAVRADVRDRAQVDALIAQAHRAFDAPVSSVVNNALVGFSFNGDARAKADEIGYGTFAEQFAGTVSGAVNVIQAALPDFDRTGSGRVINIGTNLFQHPVCRTTITPRPRPRFSH
jgi:3-oxoacyl-[acyl-carrier protein] reductase